MITKVLNYIHLILLFLPVWIYFIDIKYLRPWFKYVILILLLTPIHWELFDNNCLLTKITQLLGDFNDTSTDSQFSEKYLKWLYKPIMKNINLKWDNDGINQMVHIHWIFNFILIWYYIFFKYIRN